MQDINDKASKIKLIIFDVDGVLTDGSLFLSDDGQEQKAFNSRDGLGMVMLRQSGVAVGIITGRTSELVKIRMKSLGVEHLYQGQDDKNIAYQELKNKLSISDDEVAYVGDDIVDLPVMTQVGLAVAVQDAHPLTKELAHWVTEANGGRGAAREICELIMQAQGTLQAAFGQYLP